MITAEKYILENFTEEELPIGDERMAKMVYRLENFAWTYFLNRDDFHKNLSLVNSILKDIKDKGVYFKIGGSYSLLLYGVTDRNPSNLDLVVGRRIDFEKIRDAYNAKVFENYESKEVTEKLATQLTFVKDGITVDVFLSENNDSKQIIIEGEVYEIAHPKYAINAKVAYIKKNELILENKFVSSEDIIRFEKLKKHYSDVFDYQIWRLKQKK